MAAPPLTLSVPDGGIGRASIACTATAPGEVHALSFNVSRAWVDLLIGTVDGEGDITEATFARKALRLEPGFYVIQFAPGAATFYITAERSREGLTAITDMDFIGVAGDLELEAPWEEDDLRELRMSQSRDVRWIWHERHAPRALVRYSNASWGLIYWRADDGPFLAPGDDKIALTPADTNGTDIALVASEDYFKESHIGALFRLSHAGQRAEATITAEDTWSDPIRVSGIEDGRIFTATRSASASTVTLQRSVGTDTDWTDVQAIAAGSDEIDDGYDNAIIYYRIGVKTGDYVAAVDVELVFAAGETTGIGRVIEYTDAQNVTIDILSPFGAAVGTRYWAEGAWSAVQGYPAAGDLYDGRLWAGAVLTVWASAPDDFGSFLTGAEDADAISRQIAVGDASPIVWIKGAFRLQIGAEHGAAPIDAQRIGESASMQIRSSAFEEPITPTNMTMRDMSAKIAFVDASRMKLLRLSYDLDTNSFAADDLTRLHSGIAGAEGSGGFIDLTYQARPDQRLWVPRADGQMACCTLSEAEAVVGWVRYRLGENTLRAAEIEAEGWDDERAASIETCSAVPGVGSADLAQDFVHIIASRVLNGRQVRTHERIEKERWSEPAKAWFVECGLSYAGAPTRYLVGLDHLFGENVTCWGNGANRGEHEVGFMADIAPDAGFDDGEIGIDLGEDNEVTEAIVGLPMRTRYMSGKLAYGAAAGSAVGEKKKIGQHVNVLFYKTALGGVRYGVADANDQRGETVWFADERMKLVSDMYPDLTTMDGAPILYTGEIRLPLVVGHMIDPRIVFEFIGAGPAAILGFVANLVTNESP